MTVANPTNFRLWGNPNHLAYLKSSLRAKFPEDKLYILVPKTNAGNFTYDGIEVGGERVTQEIADELARLSSRGVSVKKLSMVGYSLGGLVARYAIGILYAKGIFDTIEPINFTTFATPHLGVRSPLRGLHNHIWNVLGARTISMSGRQLFLIDSFRDTSRPLLSVLADPDSVFLQALSRFQSRSLYANIINDRSAVYYTTGISATDPFANLSAVAINYLDDQQVLVDQDNPVSFAGSDPSSAPAARLPNFLLRLRLGIFFSLFIPIGSLLYLLNAAVQSVRSHQRIRQHAAGKMGVLRGAYDVPLFVANATRTAETVFEEMNSAHAQEYLEDNDDADEGEALLGMRRGSRAAIKEGEDGKPAFPTLALTDGQFAMIEGLDRVGWKKYPVHIVGVTHTHAAIIVRMQRESFREGKVVVGHWVDNFVL